MMIAKCDGCGQETEAVCNQSGDWFKPPNWFQRSDEEGTQLACSRPCIELIAQKTGKTKVVLPF